MLLYGTGLRIGEALGLDLADVDLESALLRIRETKFYKTRIVPVGADLTRVLRDYLLERSKGAPIPADGPFLLTSQGKRPSRAGAEEAFKQLRRQAKVSRIDGSRYQPRLHDMRHTYAVTRLVRWYREGADVQRLLPQLASFARVGLPASTMLDPGPLGCIGIGTPFGIAAALACPGRTVVVATGDGAFGFNAMEIDTAARHKVPVLIVVANNGSWAIEVRDQQESFGRVVGTRLQFADHAAMARAFGLHADRVERAEDLDAAIERALSALAKGRPALLDVLVTPEAASSDAKSGLAWVPDLQALGAWDDAERAWRKG